MLVELNSTIAAPLTGALALLGGWIRWARTPHKDSHKRIESQLDLLVNHLIGIHKPD
jgi:hypothetical protein